MIQLRLLNLDYKYDDENNKWYKENAKGRIELDIYTCEITYLLKTEEYNIDGSFEYEEFDEAMELIESILRW
ncbi:MAG: hypothetical protein ACRC1T_04780 [Clostridium chrysemydis]|uniref:hypothetical protein n=1 Tax=Clostridium chrysemydis TaxID=2665504 RepID=UPI003F346EBD